MLICAGIERHFVIRATSNIRWVITGGDENDNDFSMRMRLLLLAFANCAQFHKSSAPRVVTVADQQGWKRVLLTSLQDLNHTSYWHQILRKLPASMQHLREKLFAFSMMRGPIKKSTGPLRRNQSAMPLVFDENLFN